jgi:hypothetical protein
MKVVISAVSFPGIDIDIMQKIAMRTGAGFRIRHYYMALKRWLIL